MDCSTNTSSKIVYTLNNSYSFNNLKLYDYFNPIDFSGFIIYSYFFFFYSRRVF